MALILLGKGIISMVDLVFQVACHLSFCIGLSVGLLFWWGVLK